LYCIQPIRELKINGFKVGILTEELGILRFTGLKVEALRYTTIQSFAKSQVYIFDEFNFHAERKRQPRLSRKPDSSVLLAQVDFFSFPAFRFWVFI